MSSPTRSELEVQVPLGDGRRALIRLAEPKDAEDIRTLYREIYRGKYPLSIIYDADEAAEYLGRQDCYWFVSELAGRIVGSVIFLVDARVKLSKVFGGVVDPRFRGLGLTERAIRLGLDHIVERMGQANTVYATSRTVHGAAQRLLENLGFVELGIFPNVRKVENYETHCLTAYFKEGALRARLKPPKLPLALKPFYEIVRHATGIGDAQWSELALAPPSPYRGGWMEFEIVDAQQFIRSHWRRLQSEGKLRMQFFPFHEPNILLISADQSAQIYIYHSKPDHHAVIIGGYETAPDLTHLLNSIVMCLEEYGVRYLELLTDAYHPKVLKAVMDARFLPSAYYPAMRFKRGKGRDYIVFSKSFVVLDFKNIKTRGHFTEYLQEYFRLWKALYAEDVVG